MIERWITWLLFKPIQVGGSRELYIHISSCICLLAVTISSDGIAIVSYRTSTLMMARSIMLNELGNVEVDDSMLV